MKLSSKSCWKLLYCSKFRKDEVGAIVIVIVMLICSVQNLQYGISVAVGNYNLKLSLNMCIR